MRLLHLINEVFQRGERRLRVAGAAVEGCPVVQPVLLAEVQQGKAVAEHQQPPLSRRHRVPEGFVQLIQLGQIVRQPGLIALLMGGVGLTQRVADGLTQRLGQHGGRPHVLVVFNVIAVVAVIFTVMVMVVVVVTALHALGPFLRQRRHLRHQRQRHGDVLSGGGQNVLHPRLALAAVIEEYVRLRQRDHVQRCGLKAVRLFSGGHQQRHVHVVAADLPGEVVVGEHGAHHLQFAVLRPLPWAAAHKGDRQRQRQQQREKPLHTFSSLPQLSHRP